MRPRPRTASPILGTVHFRVIAVHPVQGQNLPELPFVNRMSGPVGPVGPVGPRVPKDEFMRALGLDHNNPHHEGYYRAMLVGPSLDKKGRPLEVATNRGY